MSEYSSDIQEVICDLNVRLDILKGRLEAALVERDEARAACREMVDAAHTSFTLPYPLARELRAKFDWLKETP